MKEPILIIENDNLTRSGFTQSGMDRYNKTINEYNKILFEKSVSQGDFDKAPDLAREVTHDHVKKAAYSIADSYGKPLKPKWLVIVQFFTYLSTGLVGLSSGYLNEGIGQFGFAASLLLGAVCFIVEKLYTNK